MKANKCDYRIKTINADFNVTEVPLMPEFINDDGEYTYIWLKKSGYTTIETLEDLVKFFGLEISDAEAEGLKDEDGVTEQIISVHKKLSRQDVEAFNEHFYNKEDDYKRIDRVIGYGDEPVAARCLHGNSFKIIIRNLSDEEAVKVKEYVRSHHFISFVNYYDNQRFGLPGGPYVTHLIGKAIHEEKWDEAFEYMKQSGNPVPEGLTGKTAFESINPKRLDFYLSSYGSYLWNNALSEYLKDTDGAEEFEFENVGKLYLPSDSFSVEKSVFEIDGYNFDHEEFKTVPHRKKRTISFSTAVYSGHPLDDEIFEGKKKISLSFFLNTGCYATMIIKQIINKALVKE